MVGWRGDFRNQEWSKPISNVTNYFLLSIIMKYTFAFLFLGRNLWLGSGIVLLFQVILFPAQYHRKLELAGSLELLVNHHIAPWRQMKYRFCVASYLGRGHLEVTAHVGILEYEIRTEEDISWSHQFRKYKWRQNPKTSQIWEVEIRD